MRVAAILLLATACAAGAAPARGATVLLRDVDRGGQVQLVDRGPCEDAGACARPAAGGWGPALQAAAGDVLELTLDAPASGAEAVLGSDPPRPFEPTADPRTWRLALPAIGDGDTGIGVLVHGQAGDWLTATLTPPRVALPRPPGPPPLAFRGAVLGPRRHAVAVRLLATHDLTVTVVLSRAGVVLGHRGAALSTGQNVVRVPLGPRARRLLRPGRHVAVALDYGAGAPLRTPAAVLLRSR